MNNLAFISIAGMILLYISGCSSLPMYYPLQGTGCHPITEHQAGFRSAAQRLLDAAINKHSLVGAQVSLSIGNDIKCDISSGTADLDRRKPLLPHHVIRLGSLTKTYTAVVILRLVEKGQLCLDDPITKWFPDYECGDRITVRMLLNHSGGLQEILGPAVMFRSTIRSHRVWTTDELLKIILGRSPAFKPGGDHRYSNSNYILLGIIAERATGKPLDVLYREEIFNPLGLRHTYFLPCEKAPPELVTGFDRDLIPLPGWHKTEPDNSAWSSFAHASGAMTANASDVMRFFEAIMNFEIVSERSYNIMTTVARSLHPQNDYLVDFGAGLFKYGDVYRYTYGHQGLFVGSEALALFDPEKRFVFVLLSNVSRIKDRDALIHKFLELIDDQLRGQQPGLPRPHFSDP